MSLINKSFQKCKIEKRPALITYTVAGDNSKKKSLDIINKISRYSDICELGFPHNTPIADGGQIQTSSYRALKNGIKIRDVFQIAKRFKNNNKLKPIILMGYYNIIFQLGENRFLKECKKAKVDGIIVVDLPYPENKNFSQKCKKNSICFIQLISPTTSAYRMKKILKDSHEMVYYISMLSTTGGKLKVKPKEIIKNYKKIKKLNKNKNCVIGFGITEKTISKLKVVDGLVIGSALCKKINDSLKNGQNPVTNVSNMVKRLRALII